jgi:3',5'-cyclic AMP phosphodiesterase CpdA
LVHSGDFTLRGTEKEIKDFNEWLGTLKFKHKIIIAGNHDFAFE